MKNVSRYTPTDLAKTIGGGLLSFPVTTFDKQAEIDDDAYCEHLEFLLRYKPAGIFAAGGTGEFFSLDMAEVGRLTTLAVEAAAASQTPVIAPAGYGTRTACALARQAEACGADGVLLFPPYLTEFEPGGLMRHIEAVCDSTGLGVVLYSRGGARIAAEWLPELAERHPNFVGYKDGIGDIELMTRVHSTMGERLTYVGGLPTAETFAQPYLDMGVTTYSSAIFNFLPRWASDFYKAVITHDDAHVRRELKDFVLPYTALRNRKRGYAVSIVKAGMKAVGRDAGGVRSPLTDLAADELEELAALIGDRT